MARERVAQGENKSVWASRLFKGGLVATGLGAVLGIGVVVELGVIAAGTGAGWYWVKDRKNK